MTDHWTPELGDGWRAARAFVDEAELHHDPIGRRFEVLVRRREAACVDALNGHPWERLQRARQGSE